MTDLIFGMGEIGSAIFELLTNRGFDCIGWDLDKAKEERHNYKKLDFIHVCIPYSENFEDIVRTLSNDYKVPIIIHSTVKPGTSKALHCCYSPVRGVHKSMVKDLEYYEKYYAVNTDFSHDAFTKRFEKTNLVADSTDLEYTKILVDTTYYGWIIAYRKHVDKIHPVYWEFAEEIHDKLGNRPIMYNDNKPIGGHCVVPNLELIDIPLFREVIH